MEARHKPKSAVIGSQSNRPLYWDSKLYGSAHGDHNNHKGAPAADRKQPNWNRGIELAPGVYHRLEAPEPVVPPGDRAQAKQPPHKVATKQLQAKLDQMEAQMRKALTAKSALHKVEKTVLLNTFGKVLRVPKVGLKQKISPADFSAVWHSLGVDVPRELVGATFNKYGQDRDGLMPVMVYVDAFLVGASRYLVKRSDHVQRCNPFKGGEARNFSGEIVYPQCRKGVFAPSNWNPQLADRSNTLPDIKLELDFVYGYSGLFNTSPNLFYVSRDEVVYYTAGVGIKYNKRLNTQCFFLEHTDDIHCIAYSQQRKLAATGQVGPVGKNTPKVCVWEAFMRSPNGGIDRDIACAKMQRRYLLELPKSDRGVTAVAFSPCGNRLATVAMDNSHTLYLWDISDKAKKAQRQTDNGGGALAWAKTTQGTYGVVWNPFDDSTLLTFGQKYIKFFTIGWGAKGAVELKGAAGRFGNPNKVRAQGPDTNSKRPVHTITAACFLSASSAVTGNQEGEICTWKRFKDGWALHHTTPAHKKGSKERCADGAMGYSGVRVLRLRADGKTLLSGGADGMVLVWSVHSGGLGSVIRSMPVVMASQLRAGEVSPKIRALDCLPGSDVFVVGTKGCDIYEVDEDPEMLIEGHSADVYGLAMSPSHPHIFATACNSSKVGVWDVSRRRNLRLVEVGRVARSVAWSPDGKQLAIGFRDGGLKVLEFYPAMQQVFWSQVAGSAIDDLKYSPCGRFLAVASHDQFVDVFDAANGFTKVGRCVGHSSTVNHLDWSRDSRIIKSTDTAREILFFSSRTCKQVKENQRDTEWATWSMVQGFDVMGIWKNTSDTTDINACDRSPDGQYLVAADDSGMIRLYNFPCVVERAPSADYLGHSSHVMNVRFASDGKHVVSVGGHDRAVFQWRVIRPTKQTSAPLVAPWVHLGGNQWGPAEHNRPTEITGGHHGQDSHHRRPADVEERWADPGIQPEGGPRQQEYEYAYAVASRGSPKHGSYGQKPPSGYGQGHSCQQERHDAPSSTRGGRQHSISQIQFG